MLLYLPSLVCSNSSFLSKQYFSTNLLKEDIMSFIGLDKREDAKDLLTEDLNNLLKTAPEEKKEV